MAKAPNGSALLAARVAAHEAFDPLWRAGHFTRDVGYRWLALKLGVPSKRAHIGKLDLDQCRRVVGFCRRFDMLDGALVQAIREFREEENWRLRKELKYASRRRRRTRETWRVRAQAKRKIFGPRFDDRRAQS